MATIRTGLAENLETTNTLGFPVDQDFQKGILTEVEAIQQSRPNGARVFIELPGNIAVNVGRQFIAASLVSNLEDQSLELGPGEVLAAVEELDKFSILAQVTRTSAEPATLKTASAAAS